MTHQGHPLFILYETISHVCVVADSCLTLIRQIKAQIKEFALDTFRGLWYSKKLFFDGSVAKW